MNKTIKIQVLLAALSALTCALRASQAPRMRTFTAVLRCKQRRFLPKLSQTCSARWRWRT